MKKPAYLDGMEGRNVETSRLTMHVYFHREEGIPVFFLHGNFSSALFWEETLLQLPPGYRGIAPDLRGYGWTEDKPIDATRGYRDWSEDICALMDTLGIERAHFVAWSLSAGIIYRLISDEPDRLLSATLISPVSIYGFGGTRGLHGDPVYPDFAGSGGGTVNAEFIQHIAEGDRSDEGMNAPRNVINSSYYKPPFRAAREEDFLTGALAERTGEKAYPGDSVPSANWPFVAPGVWGPINASAPKYIQDDAADVLASAAKPAILWIRGSDDLIVSDSSLFELGTLGKMGLVPGWPGEEAFPSQPMVSQTRTFLDAYVEAGGAYKEHVIADTAHSPHIEKPEVFNPLLHDFLKSN